MGALDGQRLLRIYQKSKKMLGKKATEYSDAQQYAEELGSTISRIVGDADFTEIDEDEIEEYLAPVLKRAYADVMAVAKTVQKGKNAAAGLGLKAIGMDFDAEGLRSIVQELAGKSVERDFIRNLLIHQIVKGADKTEEANAEAHENLGLKTHIVRKYSDRGLRYGTKYAEQCQWCLERCGEWDSYQEAKKAGCFERHPGCLCTIDYDVGKTHTASRSAGNWKKV